MTSPGSSWRRRAACRSIDPELFFPIGNTGAALVQIQVAKQVCGGCRVISACKDWALTAGEKEGVWGGTTPEERDAIKRRRQRAAARAAAGSST